MWKVNGTTVKTTDASPSLTDTLDLSVASNGNRGDIVRVEVTPNDGIVSGTTVNAQVTVENTAPVMDSASIDESAPKTNDTLHTTVSSHDVDGDVRTYGYQWQKNTGAGWNDLVWADRCDAGPVGGRQRRQG